MTRSYGETGGGEGETVAGRSVRVSGKSWARHLKRRTQVSIQGPKVEALFGSQKVGSTREIPLGEPFFPGDNWAGYATHVLAKPAACAGCGWLVSELYQETDGQKYHESLCRRCSLKKMNPRARAARSRRRLAG